MTERPSVGVGVLIFNEHNQILLGKRTASHGQSTWAPVGGHLEFGESFEECAIRETLEEAGLKIEPPEFLGLTNDVFSESNKHYISVFVRAQCPRGQEPQNLEPHKTEKWEWFAEEDVPENLFLPLKKVMFGKFYGLRAALFETKPLASKCL